MSEEMFDVIDDATGAVIGTMPRRVCHGHPEYVHRAVHVAVYHPDGRILLQKRTMTKDIQPGKWDTACGGHLAAGETWEQGVVRELGEELGIHTDISHLKHLFDFKVRNEIESENIRVFHLVTEGPFRFQKEEIDEVAFFTKEELRRKLDSGNADDLTPLVRRELELLPGFRI